MSLIVPILVLRTLAALQAFEPTTRVDEVALEPSPTRFIEARIDETVIRGRPWVPYRRVATVVGGTRLAVRGQVASRDKEGCHGKIWYAVLPFGYVCSEHAKPTEKPPDLGRALPVAEGERLPFSYALTRGDIPFYADTAAIDSGIPTRKLKKGMTFAIEKSRDYMGIRYLEPQGGGLIPKSGLSFLGQASPLHGVRIEVAETFVGPAFAWANRKPTKVLQAPNPAAAKVRELALRERVPLLESAEHDGKRYWRIGADAWVLAEHLNEVHITPPPKDIAEGDAWSRANRQWVDVDTGEQVLVAYRGSRPEFATLVASGRDSPTPRGDYPIWAKVASMDMANQDYEDDAYLVQAVPWVLLFQAHNALHGAYWHDRFGNRKSHGCVNLAPLDARWMFNWAGPSFPAGWTGYLPSALERSIVVHVRDSSLPPVEAFTQERPIGPPNTEEEQAKIEEAKQRRALEEAAALEALPSIDEPNAVPWFGRGAAPTPPSSAPTSPSQAPAQPAPSAPPGSSPSPSPSPRPEPPPPPASETN